MSQFSIEALLRASGATQFVDDMKRASSSVSNFKNKNERAFNKMKSVGSSMKSTGKIMTAAITLPLAGIAAAAVKTGAQFDDQMSTVKAVTGATGDQMDSMRNQAKELGRSTRFSASEAAEGMEMLGRAGFDTDEIMDALPATLDLASAGAVDLGDAADITSNILSGFGMEAKETARVADILAQASADSNTDVEGLGESFKYVAPIASSLGIDIEDVAASIGTLGDAGIQGGQAGRMLRKGLQDLAAPSAEAASLMDELGIEVFDANGEMKDMPSVIGELDKGLDGMKANQKQAALETLFGANAMSAWSILVDEGEEGLGEFTEELKNSEGAASDMSDEMEDNLAGSFRELKSAAEGVLISINDMGKGPLRSLIDKLVDLVRWFDDTSDSTKQWIIILAGVAAAIGPLLIVLGTIIGFLPTLITGFKILATVFGVVAGAISWPVVLIGALVAALVAAYAASETFREKVNAAFTFVKDIIMEVIGFVVEFIQEKWQFIMDWWGENQELFAEIASEKWEQVKEVISTVMEFLQPFLEGAWENIKMYVMIAWDAIKAIIDIALELITGIIKASMQIINEDWEGAWDTVKEMFSNIWEIIKNLLSDVLDSIVQNIRNQLDILNEMTGGKLGDVQKVFTDVFNTVKDIVIAAWDYIKDTFSNALQFLKGLVNLDFGMMKDAIQKQMDSSKKFLSKVWSAIKDNMSDYIDKIKQYVRNKFEDIKQAIRDKIDAAKQAVKDKFQAMLDSVIDKAQSIVDSAKDKFNAAKDAIMDPIETAKDKISGYIDDIKGFFDNLKLKIPKPEMPSMPSFSLKTSSKKIMGKSISYPTGIGVNWNAEGGIFKRPTIFNTANAGMQGVGEAGSEAIIPLNNRTLGTLGKMIQRATPNESVAGNNNFTNKQPATINVAIGGQEFSAFVDDITENQDRKKLVRDAFRR